MEALLVIAAGYLGCDALDNLARGLVTGRRTLRYTRLRTCVTLAECIVIGLIAAAGAAQAHVWEPYVITAYMGAEAAGTLYAAGSEVTASRAVSLMSACASIVFVCIIAATIPHLGH